MRLVSTSHASLIRFPETALRPLGRTAAGVKGITLREDDKVVGLDVTKVESDDEILVVTEMVTVNVHQLKITDYQTVVVKVLKQRLSQNVMVM